MHIPKPSVRGNMLVTGFLHSMEKYGFDFSHFYVSMKMEQGKQSMEKYCFQTIAPIRSPKIFIKVEKQLTLHQRRVFPGIWSSTRSTAFSNEWINYLYLHCAFYSRAIFKMYCKHTH